MLIWKWICCLSNHIIKNVPAGGNVIWPGVRHVLLFSFRVSSADWQTLRWCTNLPIATLVHVNVLKKRDLSIFTFSSPLPFWPSLFTQVHRDIMMLEWALQLLVLGILVWCKPQNRMYTKSEDGHVGGNLTKCFRVHYGDDWGGFLGFGCISTEEA